MKELEIIINSESIQKNPDSASGNLAIKKGTKKALKSDKIPQKTAKKTEKRPKRGNKMTKNNEKIVKSKENLEVNNQLTIYEKRIAINRKWLFNSYDTVIKSLMSKGVYFFGLTINFNCDIIQESKKTCINLFTGESENFNNPQEYIKFLINYYNNSIFSKIELIDFSYAVIEKSERENYYHTHILLCVRSITSEIDNVHLHILKIFDDVETFAFIDYKLDILKHFLDAKKFLRYMSKDLDKLDKNLNQFYFHYFSNLNLVDYASLEQQIEVYIADEYSLHIPEIVNYNLSDFLSRNMSFNGKYNLIEGHNFKKSDDKQLILYYINLYLKLNNMFFYNNSLYIKNHKSQFSYICIGGYTKLLELLPDIFKFFSSCFDTISFDEIWGNLIKHPLHISNIIKTDIKLFHSKAINFNILEFLDGIFSLEYNLFIPFERLNLESSKELKLLRYYNVNYINNVQTKPKPKTWLKYLAKNVDNLDTFCAQFGQYFYDENNIDKNKRSKQNTMFIHGVSSSGKSLLLTKLLVNAWGPENITMIIDNSSFTFEDMGTNKKLMINDEFTYKSKDRSSLLKLLDKAPMAINRKFKSANIHEYNINTIFLANYSKENIALLEDVAFKNRLNVYDFKTEFKISPQEILKIKMEEPKILIYCNRFFLKDQNKLKRLQLSSKQKEIIYENILLLK